MKKIILLICVVTFCLIVPQAGSYGSEVIDIKISTSEIPCQIVGENECQLLTNFINLTIKTKTGKDLKLNIEPVVGDGKEILGIYAKKCVNLSHAIYNCGFFIDPVLQLNKEKRFMINIPVYASREGMKRELIGTYSGDLVIKPARHLGLLDLNTQENAIENSLEYLKLFAKDSIFSSGICITYGVKDILFYEIDRYEEEVAGIVGQLTHLYDEITLERAKNLLMLLLTTHFGSRTKETYTTLYNGYHTGLMVKGIDLKYAPRSVLNLVEKISDSCEELKTNFSKILDVFLVALQKKKFVECLEGRKFNECTEIADNATTHAGMNPSRKASLKIYVNDALLKDNANICSNSKIEIEYRNMNRVGVDYIEVMGAGKLSVCDNIIYIENSGRMKIDAMDFLCGPFDYPVDSSEYKIKIGQFTYRVKYYEDPDKCRVRQESISVD